MKQTEFILLNSTIENSQYESLDSCGHKFCHSQQSSTIRCFLKPEVERVQKYSTQVKVPLHYWNFTTSKSTSLKIYSSKSKK